MPNVRWRQQKHNEWYESETWFAQYRGWTLYVGKLIKTGEWRARLHRFTTDGMADAPSCERRYATLEGAQNAAEFYAENGRFPHAGLPSA